MPRRREEVIAQAIASLRGSNAEEVINADLDHWTEVKGLLSELSATGPLSGLSKLSSHTIGKTVTSELQHGPRPSGEKLL